MCLNRRSGVNTRVRGETAAVFGMWRKLSANKTEMTSSAQSIPNIIVCAWIVEKLRFYTGNVEIHGLCAREVGAMPYATCCFASSIISSFLLFNVLLHLFMAY